MANNQNLKGHEFTSEQDKPHYDKVWQGWFTPEQVEWMNEKYVQYSEDFVLDNINMQDYTRKVIKGSRRRARCPARRRRWNTPRGCCGPPPAAPAPAVRPRR